MRAVSLFVALATMSVATSVSAQGAPAPAPLSVAPVEPVQPIGLVQQQQQAPLLAVYDQQSKNRFGALALEYFLPGVGCIYAGNPAAAFKTWVMTLGGAAVFFYGLQLSNDGFTGKGPEGMMIGGMISLLMGRVLGLYDAWSSAADYNAELRAAMGLVED
jgi:hypothetical protein